MQLAFSMQKEEKLGHVGWKISILILNQLSVLHFLSGKKKVVSKCKKKFLFWFYSKLYILGKQEIKQTELKLSIHLLISYRERLI